MGCHVFVSICKSKFNKVVIIIHALFLLGIMLAGCTPKNSDLAPEIVQTIGVNNIEVVNQNSASQIVSHKIDSNLLVAQLKQAVAEQTADLKGPKKVDVKIVVTGYLSPNLGGDLLGVTNRLMSKVSVVDVATGKKLIENEAFEVNEGDFDGGNWFLINSFGKESDKKYVGMVGLYSRKFRGWLLNKNKK